MINLSSIIDRISQIKVQKQGGPVIIAIDGRCGAGKSTAAKKLQDTFSCNVFHMDDFYLQPFQRTKERYGEPGGNVDRERFLDEVMLKLVKNEPFSYRPFDCHTMELSGPVNVTPDVINIVEGTYSLHPLLRDYYDLRIFITIDSKEQLSRIEKRNPDKADMFKNRWIPLEEKYFSTYDIEQKCDIVINGLS